MRSILAVKDHCENLIREGQVAHARQELLSLKSGQIPRNLRTDFANFARRTGLFHWGLRLLKPYVRPSEILVEPTAKEKSTYAALLIKLGLIDESLELLASIKDPLAEKHLYSAFAHMNRWEYRFAVPYLKRYLASSEIGDYQKAVAQVNLISSLVFLERHHEVNGLIAELVPEARSRGWKLLHLNLLELSAQSSLSQGDWQLARKYLQVAQHGSEGAASSSQLYVHKWTAIVDLMQSGASDKRIAAIAEVRNRASALLDWETVRDCDYYLGRITENQERLVRVYFGTPFLPFRHRMRKETSHWLVLPKYFEWTPSQLNSVRGQRVFNLDRGCEQNSLVTLDSMPTLHRAFSSLCSDFYRPLSLGNLFSQLYPGAYFDPDSSARRVLQTLHRLQSWFRDQKIPLTIVARHREYRLEGADYVIRIGHRAKAGQVKSQDDNRVSQLKKTFAYKSFSSRQAARELGVSWSSVKELLKRAKVAGKVKQCGSGRGTLYYIKAS